jgi:RNA polymerase sigma-70 factor, ECF subfamily
VSSDDRSLIVSARAGSGDAAAALVERYWDEAYRIAWLILRDRYAAEDSAQEAMLAALKSLSSFDAQRPFGPWLRAIAANKARDAIRRQERRGELVMTPETVGDLAADALADEIAELAHASELEIALQRLDPDQRLIVVLRHVLGYTPSEIAAELVLPAATVRTRLHRALLRLRGELDANQGAVGDQTG